MSTLEINAEVNAKLDHVRAVLARELTGKGDVCLTCSFQAEDVLLTKLAIALDPRDSDSVSRYGLPLQGDVRVPGPHCERVGIEPDEPAAGRRRWRSRRRSSDCFIRSAPDKCCGLRKVEPLFKALAGYRVWLTGLRKEQAKSRAALEERALFTLPGGVQVLKLAPLAEWTTRDVWYACEQLAIPLLPLYEQGYSSIGCEPCTSIPTDPNDPRSGRWAGRKVECGIHIEAAPVR